MEIDEIKQLIKIGFDKPKLYKRSVWNKAVKIMEFICSIDSRVERCDFGPGLEKYCSLHATDTAIKVWAEMYKKSINE